VTDNFPIAGAAERAAFMRAFLRLHIALRDSFLAQHPDLMDDADVGMLMVISGAVILGHSEGRPMTAHKVAVVLNLDRMTVKRKLDKLVKLGPFVLHDDHYYLAPERAGVFPPKVEADFSRAFYDLVKEMGPHLHKYQHAGMKVRIEPAWPDAHSRPEPGLLKLSTQVVDAS
jgi:hypothetical protein